MYYRMLFEQLKLTAGAGQRPGVLTQAAGCIDNTRVFTVSSEKRPYTQRLSQHGCAKTCFFHTMSGFAAHKIDTQLNTIDSCQLQG